MPVRHLCACSAFVVTLLGCSGASSTEIADDPNAMTPATASTDAPSKSTSASAQPGAKSTSTSAAPASAPTGKPTSEAPASPPLAPCTPEAEPNDSPSSASPFTSRVCGTLDGDDDVDFVVFQAPDGARSMIVKHADQGGAIDYRYFIDGVQIPSVAGYNEPLLAIRGARYTVMATSAQRGAHPTYEISVSFE